MMTSLSVNIFDFYILSSYCDNNEGLLKVMCIIEVLISRNCCKIETVMMDN